MHEDRIAGIIDLATKPADVDVDEVRARIESVAPHALEQHCPRDRLPLVTHEIFENPELPRQQVEGAPAAPRGPREKVQFKVTETQHRISRLG